MAAKVSDLIAGGILSGRYQRSIQTCPCENCKQQRTIRFTAWVNGIPYQLSPLEVALLEKTGNPLPWSEAQSTLDLPATIVDQVVHRANTSADDCIQFLRSQGF